MWVRFKTGVDTLDGLLFQRAPQIANDAIVGGIGPVGIALKERELDPCVACRLRLQFEHLAFDPRQLVQHFFPPAIKAGKAELGTGAEYSLLIFLRQLERVLRSTIRAVCSGVSGSSRGSSLSFRATRTHLTRPAPIWAHANRAAAHPDARQRNSAPTLHCGFRAL
jgi:hypothetical protein